MLGRIDQGSWIHESGGSRALNIDYALSLLSIWSLHIYHQARLLTVLHRGRVDAALLGVQALLFGIVHVLCDDDAAALLKLLEDAYGVFLVLLHLLLLQSVPLLFLDLAGFLVKFAVEWRLLTLSVRKHKRLLLLLLVPSLIIGGVTKLVHLDRRRSYLRRLNHPILFLLRYHLGVVNLAVMVPVAVEVEDYTTFLCVIASVGDGCRGDVMQLGGRSFNKLLGLLLQEVLLLLQSWLDVQLLVLLATCDLRHRDGQRDFAATLLKELIRCLICDRAHGLLVRSLTLLTLP
jgi:hypothetical protein